MTQGDNRRKKKRYRVRYDRIVVLALIIALIAVLASSCYKAVTKDEDEPESSASVSDTETPTDAPEESESIPEESETEVPGSPEFVTVELDKEASLMGDLILVNADHEYTFPSGDIEPITIVGNRNDCYQAGDYNTLIDRKVLIRLNALMSEYAVAMGLPSTDVFVQDGYRTYEQQYERHNSGMSKTFEAGHSDYHTGRTFDMFRYDGSSATGFAYFEADTWFAENAGTYGFILRYPEGKEDKTGENPRTYTYRYVGAPHASYINSNGLCLEEYIELVKGHNNEDPLEVSDAFHTYQVYYTAAAESGKTSVSVPADKEYVISGDNAGGFIVTVMLS